MIRFQIGDRVICESVVKPYGAGTIVDILGDNESFVIKLDKKPEACCGDELSFYSGEVELFSGYEDFMDKINDRMS